MVPKAPLPVTYKTYEEFRVAVRHMTVPAKMTFRQISTRLIIETPLSAAQRKTLDGTPFEGLYRYPILICDVAEVLRHSLWLLSSYLDSPIKPTPRK